MLQNGSRKLLRVYGARCITVSAQRTIVCVLHLNHQAQADGHDSFIALAKVQIKARAACNFEAIDSTGSHHGMWSVIA